MGMRHLRRAAACAAVVFAASAAARADVVTYEVRDVFNGSGSHGTRPYLRLTFDDAAVAGGLRLTAEAPGLGAEEYVTQLNLNLDPALNIIDLTFTNFQLVAGNMFQPTLDKATDALEAGGGGLFDAQLNFSDSGGGLSRRWNVGEVWTVDILGAGLTAASFGFDAALPAPEGAQPLAAHILHFSSAEDRGWLTIPEPTAAGLLVAGLAGVTLRRRRA